MGQGGAGPEEEWGELGIWAGKIGEPTRGVGKVESRWNPAPLEMGPGERENGVLDRESGGRAKKRRRRTEHLHEPASRLGAAGPRACRGGTEMVQHKVVQPAWPGQARQPGASP